MFCSPFVAAAVVVAVVIAVVVAAADGRLAVVAEEASEA